jgi:kynurenine formamidase
VNENAATESPALDGASRTSGSKRTDGPVSKERFDELFEQVCSWERWPKDKRGVGALNALSSELVLEALSTVRQGQAIKLSLALSTVAGVDNAKPALHYMSDLGDREPPEPTTYKDFVGVDYHGKAVTHLDALSHIAYRGRLFGGAEARQVATTGGMTYADVAQLPPIVVRAHLLDMPFAAGVEWLEPGTPVGVEDLRLAIERLGLEIRAGDALLLRTGHQGRRRALGPWDADRASAGWHVEALPELWSLGVSVLGSDGDSDLRPSPVEGVSSPVHVLAITAMGVPLLDNLDLEELAAACQALQRWTFALLALPLVVPGGTGSPLTPVALL